MDTNIFIQEENILFDNALKNMEKRLQMAGRLSQRLSDKRLSLFGITDTCLD